MAERRAACELALRAAFDADDFAEVATLALRGYGPELYSYLVATLRSASDADEAFAMFSEDLWRGLPAFGWGCSFRTWSYLLARNAGVRLRTRGFARAVVPLSEVSGISALAEEIRTTTAVWLRTEAKDKLAELRESLPAEDIELLVLRADRELEWVEIARALGAEEADLTEESARLRKRWQRLKQRLREAGARAGLLQERS